MNKKTAENIFRNKKYYSKGKRGFIYLSSNKYVIKTKNPDSEKDPVELEAYYNEKLNRIAVGPKFYFYDKEKNFMIREFVEGHNIMEWILLNKEKKNFKKNLIKIIINLLKQCRKMDLAGINKMEMTHPHKDIIVRKNIPYIIDFERCRSTRKPKNVTQFCQFISGGNFFGVINDVDINFDSKIIKNLSTEYKRSNYSENSFKKILSCLSK